MRINSMEQWILGGVFGGILLAAGWGYHVEIKLTQLGDNERVIIAILRDKLQISDFTMEEANGSCSRKL